MPARRHSCETLGRRRLHRVVPSNHATSGSRGPWQVEPRPHAEGAAAGPLRARPRTARPARGLRGARPARGRFSAIHGPLSFSYRLVRRTAGRENLINTRPAAGPPRRTAGWRPLHGRLAALPPLWSGLAATAARLSSTTARQNQEWSPELPNSWRTGHAPLMSHLIIARTVGPRPQVFLQGATSSRKCAP